MVLYYYITLHVYYNNYILYMYMYNRGLSLQGGQPKPLQQVSTPTYM